MRIRAARASLAIAALAAALAVAGVAGSHVGARWLERPVNGMAAAPAHAAAAGLPGLHGLHAHARVNAVDVLLAPATLLVMLVLVAVAVRRSRRPLQVAPSVGHARGPPALR